MTLLRRLLGRSTSESEKPTFSAILFDPPSFITGMARAIDIGNTLTDFNKSVTPEHADLLAIKADFRAVGHDFRKATDRVANADTRLRGVREEKSRPVNARRRPARAY